MDRPNLAILTLDFPPSTGGVQAYLYEIFNRLADEFRVSVLTPSVGELPASSAIEKIDLLGGKPAAFYAALRSLGLAGRRRVVNQFTAERNLAGIELALAEAMI